MIPSKLGASDAILGSKCRVEWGGGTIEYGSLQLSGKPTKRRRSQLIMACILMPNRVAIATLSSPSWLLKPTASMQFCFG
ncbi:unnamed protein product [Musa acuminata var. zebrina]